jgi:hypothetical protein
MSFLGRVKAGIGGGLAGFATGGPWGAAAGAAASQLTYNDGGGSADLPSYADMYQNLHDFEMPSQFNVDPASFDPYLANAQAMISRGYGNARYGVQGALSQFQGGPGYAALQGAANRGKRAFNFALDTRKKGEARLDDEIARIEQLEAGGYDIFSDPQALAEIAPELGAGSKLFNEVMDRGVWNPRGGVGEAMAGQARRDFISQAGTDLQEAIRQNRATKLGISEAQATRDALADPNMQAYLALADADKLGFDALAGLYAGEADAGAKLGGQYFGATTDAIVGNADRALKAFGLLQNGMVTLEEAKAQLSAEEQAQLNQLMQEAGTAAGQIFNPKKDPMTMPTDPNIITPGWQDPGGAVRSDSRTKSSPGRVSGALSAARKLPVYDYHYNALAGELDGTPGRGLMAQDIEKIPSMKHLVRKDPSGLRSVDVYGVASTALAAVQELDDKIKRLERKKWRVSRRKVA